MSCARHRKAIAAHAAGAAPDRPTARHLADCAGCRELLARQRALLAELDAELASALSIGASPELCAGVDRAVHSVARAAPVRVWRTAGWLGLAAAAAMVAAVILRPPETAPAGPQAPATAAVNAAAPRPATAAAAADGLEAAHTLAPAGPRAPRVRRSIATAGVETPGEELPPVIVPPDQARALARLNELVRSGRWTSRLMPVQPAPSPDDEIAVPPIDVNDISVPDVEIVSGPASASAPPSRSDQR